MADRAIVIEVGQQVIGIVGLGEITLVTSVAVLGGASVSIGMATGAVRGLVRPREREVGEFVIDACRFPGSSRMTCLTGLRESGQVVNRILSVGVVALVTSNALGSRRRVSGGMAINTNNRLVRSSQREASLFVIHCRRRPGNLGVTFGAILSEVVFNVIGVGGLGIVRFVARITIFR